MRVPGPDNRRRSPEGVDFEKRNERVVTLCSTVFPESNGDRSRDNLRDEPPGIQPAMLLKGRYSGRTPRRRRSGIQQRSRGKDCYRYPGESSLRYAAGAGARCLVFRAQGGVLGLSGAPVAVG